VRKVESQLQELQRARRTHLAQLRQMAERQLAEIAAAEREELPAVSPAPSSRSDNSEGQRRAPAAERVEQG
jgi:hypothetical protein